MGLGRQEGDVAKATLPVGSSDAQRLRLQSLWTMSRGQGNVVCGRDIIVFSPHVFWEWLGRRGFDKFYGFYSGLLTTFGGSQGVFAAGFAAAGCKASSKRRCEPPSGGEEAGA